VRQNKSLKIYLTVKVVKMTSETTNELRCPNGHGLLVDFIDHAYCEKCEYAIKIHVEEDGFGF